jgi:hypothetical protein
VGMYNCCASCLRAGYHCHTILFANTSEAGWEDLSADV